MRGCLAKYRLVLNLFFSTLAKSLTSSPDVVWREKEHKGGFVHSMGVGHKHTCTFTHTYTPSVHAAHLFLALLPLFTHRVSEVNALIVRSECVITVTRARKQIYDSQLELQRLYFSPGPVLKKS